MNSVLPPSGQWPSRVYHRVNGEVKMQRKKSGEGSVVFFNMIERAERRRQLEKSDDAAKIARLVFTEMRSNLGQNARSAFLERHLCG